MNMKPSLTGAAALTHWGVIRARGADTLKFLQGQLTNDVATLSPSQARLAGFCSAKGRLQASFVMWAATPDEVLLACPLSVLGATMKRLSMFVMRAQCKLTDATTELPLWGLAGDAALPRLSGMAVWDKRDAEGSTFVRVPDAGGVPRCLQVGTPASGETRVADVATLSLDDWRWLDVQSGVPTIEAATAEKFVPQMLNYELVGGVDFRKGCYPGQEVVARSQYRGTVKRRMFLFDIDIDIDAGVVEPGQEVFHSDDPAQPAGMVVNVAPRPGAGLASSALVEVKLASLDGGTLFLGAVGGPILVQRELPYPVASNPVDGSDEAGAA